MKKEIEALTHICESLVETAINIEQVETKPRIGDAGTVAKAKRNDYSTYRYHLIQDKKRIVKRLDELISLVPYERF